MMGRATVLVAAAAAATRACGDDAPQRYRHTELLVVHPIAGEASTPAGGEAAPVLSTWSFLHELRVDESTTALHGFPADIYQLLLPSLHASFDGDASALERLTVEVVDGHWDARAWGVPLACEPAEQPSSAASGGSAAASQCVNIAAPPGMSISAVYQRPAAEAGASAVDGSSSGSACLSAATQRLARSLLQRPHAVADTHAPSGSACGTGSSSHLVRALLRPSQAVTVAGRILAAHPWYLPSAMPRWAANVFNSLLGVVADAGVLTLVALGDAAAAWQKVCVRLVIAAGCELSEAHDSRATPSTSGSQPAASIEPDAIAAFRTLLRSASSIVGVPLSANVAGAPVTESVDGAETLDWDDGAAAPLVDGGYLTASHGSGANCSTALHWHRPPISSATTPLGVTTLRRLMERAAAPCGRDAGAAGLSDTDISGLAEPAAAGGSDEAAADAVVSCPLSAATHGGVVAVELPWLSMQDDGAAAATNASTSQLDLDEGLCSAADGRVLRVATHEPSPSSAAAVEIGSRPGRAVHGRGSTDAAEWASANDWGKRVHGSLPIGAGTGVAATLVPHVFATSALWHSVRLEAWASPAPCSSTSSAADVDPRATLRKRFVCAAVAFRAALPVDAVSEMSGAQAFAHEPSAGDTTAEPPTPLRFSSAAPDDGADSSSAAVGRLPVETLRRAIAARWAQPRPVHGSMVSVPLAGVLGLTSPLQLRHCAWRHARNAQRQPVSITPCAAFVGLPPRLSSCVRSGWVESSTTDAARRTDVAVWHCSKRGHGCQWQSLPVGRVASAAVNAAAGAPVAAPAGVANDSIAAPVSAVSADRRLHQHAFGAATLTTIVVVRTNGRGVDTADHACTWHPVATITVSDPIPWFAEPTRGGAVRAAIIDGASDGWRVVAAPAGVTFASGWHDELHSGSSHAAVTTVLLQARSCGAAAATAVQEDVRVAIAHDFVAARMPAAERLPPDTHRGMELPAGRVSVQQWPTGVASQGLYTQTVLLEPHSPDFSMPYNVMTLISTVLAFGLGTFINVLARKPRARAPRTSAAAAAAPTDELVLGTGPLVLKPADATAASPQ